MESAAQVTATAHDDHGGQLEPEVPSSNGSTISSIGSTSADTAATATEEPENEDRDRPISFYHDALDRLDIPKAPTATTSDDESAMNQDLHGNIIAATDTASLTTNTSEPSNAPDETDSGGAALTQSASTSSFVPYWSPAPRHGRTVSAASYLSIDTRPAPITLEDNTLTPTDKSRGLWAKHVTIEDYTVVEGSIQGIGAYVVWNVVVDTLEGGPLLLHKRYSEFDRLRHNLVKTFPQAGGSLPQLPPKSVISKFRSRFLDRRREGLEYFMNCVLLNPEFSGSPVLKDFLFN